MDDEMIEMSDEELSRLRRQLDSECERRRQEKVDEKRAENLKIIKEVKASDVLGVMRHDRTTCSDENPQNGYESDRGYARCRKCHLMEVLEFEDDRFEVQIQVDITMNGV